jgi:hypothetical protein
VHESFDGPTARDVPFFFRHIKSGEETIALNILRAKRAKPTVNRCKGCDKPTYHQQGEKKNLSTKNKTIYTLKRPINGQFLYKPDRVTISLLSKFMAVACC